MLLTFNVGVTEKNELRQISFKKAVLDVSAKDISETTFAVQNFDQHEFTFNEPAKQISVTFLPDKTALTPVIQKCVFDGVIRESGITGELTFFMQSGEPVKVVINP
jgi:hypothetical protein